MLRAFGQNSVAGQQDDGRDFLEPTPEALRERLMRTGDVGVPVYTVAHRNGAAVVRPTSGESAVVDGATAWAVRVHQEPPGRTMRFRSCPGPPPALQDKVSASRDRVTLETVRDTPPANTSGQGSQSRSPDTGRACRGVQRFESHAGACTRSRHWTHHPATAQHSRGWLPQPCLARHAASTAASCSRVGPARTSVWRSAGRPRYHISRSDTVVASGRKVSPAARARALLTAP